MNESTTLNKSDAHAKQFAVEVENCNGWAEVARFADRRAADLWARSVLRTAGHAISAVRVGETDEPTLFQLMHAVRAHPQFVAGAIWTLEDFLSQDLAALNIDRLEDVIIERGNCYIDGELGYPE